VKPQPCISHAEEQGDCWRASLASVLNLPVEEVPHFVEVVKHDPNPEELYRETRRWLLERGLGFFQTTTALTWTLADILRWLSEPNPGIPLIIVGDAKDDNHAVVAMDGRVVLDHGSPLTGPPRDAKGEPCSWWLYVVAFAHDSAVPWSFET
jgi:hypothetical protein